MLEAKKHKWFSKFFTAYNRNLLKRRFNSFRVSGFNDFQNTSCSIPSIVYANHSSWWDGLAAFELLTRAGLNQFVLMEKEQLERFLFFRYLGAFGIDRKTPRDGLICIRYAARLLEENPQNALLIFPQGKILPNEYPLVFFSGLARLVKLTGHCRVIPLAFRFEFLENFKPDIFAAIGPPMIFRNESRFDVKIQTKLFAQKLNELLLKQKLAIVESQTDSYIDLFA